MDRIDFENNFLRIAFQNNFFFQFWFIFYSLIFIRRPFKMHSICLLTSWFVKLEKREGHFRQQELQYAKQNAKTLDQSLRFNHSLSSLLDFCNPSTNHSRSPLKGEPICFRLVPERSDERVSYFDFESPAFFCSLLNLLSHPFLNNQRGR